LTGSVGCTGVTGVLDLPEEPRLKGNALREALDGVVRSGSLGDERELFREGFWGTSASFGGANLEARRGVKECERM
jgi:hypothetical protein